jgi:uncharacterized membrane protein
MSVDQFRNLVVAPPVLPFFGLDLRIKLLADKKASL